jgi:ASF1 like histone chaperone
MMQCTSSLAVVPFTVVVTIALDRSTSCTHCSTCHGSDGRYCAMYTTSKLLSCKSDVYCVVSHSMSSCIYLCTVLLTGLLLCLSALMCIHTHHHHITDLDWKVVYVGSAEDTKRDQVLEEVGVGPVHLGINKFILEVQ